jgi:YtkA-like
MRSRWAVFLLLALPLAPSACSSDKPGENGSPVGGTGGTMNTDGAVVNCTNDPRVDTYVANLKKAGQQNVLTFTMVESTPAPPARGSNVMKLKITKADQTPVTGALQAKIKMPDHGHESSVQPTITLDPSTSTYTVDPAYLFMPGVWLLQFTSYEGAADAGAPLDIGSFYFCIEG